MAQAPTPSPPQGESDPSMDDILASIRRILSDEEKAAKAQRPDDGVLMLDPSMMIDDSTPAEHLVPEAASEPKHAPLALPEPEPPHAVTPTPPPAPSMSAPSAPITPAPAEPAPPGDPLVAPEAAAAAASSVGALMRTLVAERSALVHRGGPTLEDIVREEMRPVLKVWLDMHLPALVERLVRAEIERVVGRLGG